jgi:O-antigen ligase
MSSIPRLSTPEKSDPRSIVTGVLIFLGGVALAVAVGYLVVTGKALLGIAAVFAVPAFILLHRYPWSAVLIWLLVGPLFAETIDSTGRQMYWIVHRALPPAALIIMVLASRLRIKVHTFPRLGLPELAMLAYVILSIFSIAMTNERPLATFYLFYDRVISPMCLYLLVRLWSPTKADLHRLAPTILVMLLIQLVVGLIAWYAPSMLPAAWVKEEFGRTTGTLSSYGAFAAMVIFAGVFLLRAGLNHRAGWVRRLYFISFVLAGFGVFMSFSRGAWLAGCLVVLGLTLIDPKRVLQVALIAIPTVYFLITGPLSDQLDWAKERLYSEESEQSALIRLPVFQASLRMLAAKPVFGWGYENFNRYDTRFYTPVEGLRTPVKDLSSHNSYLTLLAEQGLVGTLLFLTPCFWWSMKSVQKIFRMPSESIWGRKSLILSWLFIIAYVTINMFHNMRVPFGLATWWLGLALIANIIERQEAAKPTEVQLQHALFGR